MKSKFLISFLALSLIANYANVKNLDNFKEQKNQEYLKLVYVDKLTKNPDDTYSVIFKDVIGYKWSYIYEDPDIELNDYYILTMSKNNTPKDITDDEILKIKYTVVPEIK